MKKYILDLLNSICIIFLVFLVAIPFIGYDYLVFPFYGLTYLVMALPLFIIGVLLNKPLLRLLSRGNLINSRKILFNAKMLITLFIPPLGLIIFLDELSVLEVLTDRPLISLFTIYLVLVAGFLKHEQGKIIDQDVLYTLFTTIIYLVVFLIFGVLVLFAGEFLDILPLESYISLYD